MKKLYIKDITPQAAAIYQLLLRSNSLTAAQIGKALAIYPHAVYRSIRSLGELGLIEKSFGYPVEYQAKPFEDGISMYLNNARENFLQSFFARGIDSNVSSTKAADRGLQVGFIKNRQDMLEQSNDDVRKAKKEIAMIFSGLIGSAETVLAYTRASERGVRIRFIVQRLDETNKEMLLYWKNLGVEVRYFSLIEARILLFDSQIAYIVSYNPEEKEEGVGVRFNYAPVTLLMEELFEKRWMLSKEIT